MAIGDQAQVGERVLDFRALEEAQAAIDAVRHARRSERLFQHARLGVGAVQDRDLAARAAAVGPLADALHDEVRLVALVDRRRTGGSFRRAAPCVQRFLPSRPELCAMSAFAASRIAPVER